jgi:hypothetical protein
MRRPPAENVSCSPRMKTAILILKRVLSAFPDGIREGREDFLSS